MADEGRQKEAAFDAMSRGWVLGSRDYRQAVLEDLVKTPQAGDWGGEEVRELNRLRWAKRLEAGLAALGRKLGEAPGEPKSADWKVALAAWLKRETSVSNRWLTEQLHMGAPDAVSRYVGEVARGERGEASKLVEALTTRVRG